MKFVYTPGTDFRGLFLFFNESSPDNQRLFPPDALAPKALSWGLYEQGEGDSRVDPPT